MASEEKKGFWAYRRILLKHEHRLYRCGGLFGLAIGILLGVNLSRLVGYLWSAIVLLPVAAVLGTMSIIIYRRITLVPAGENSSEIHDKKDAGCEQGEESEI